jgi:hypothetical protein
MSLEEMIQARYEKYLNYGKFAEEWK